MGRERENTPGWCPSLGPSQRAPVKPEAVEAPAAMPAVCSGPVRPGRGLGEEWSAGLTED